MLRFIEQEVLMYQHRSARFIEAAAVRRMMKRSQQLATKDVNLPQLKPFHQVKSRCGLHQLPVVDLEPQTRYMSDRHSLAGHDVTLTTCSTVVRYC